MLRPAVNELITKNESYYSLVVAVAKRARKIADDLYENNQILEEKPVKTAIDELATKKWKLIEDPAAKMTLDKR